MSDAHSGAEVIVAELKLLGEISPNHGHRIVEASDAGTYRQHGREADNAVTPERPANLGQDRFVEEGAVAGRRQLDSAEFYVERVFLRRDHKVRPSARQFATD